MKILGISPLDKDATASIVEDGEVLFAAGEERFSRKKQQDGFPWQAVEQALSYTNTSVEEIDKVVYPFMSAEAEQKLISKNMADEEKFLQEFQYRANRREFRQAMNSVPTRTGQIHGLDEPGQKMEKNLFHKAFYHLAIAATRFQSVSYTGLEKWAAMLESHSFAGTRTFCRGWRSLGWVPNCYVWNTI